MNKPKIIESTGKQTAAEFRSRLMMVEHIQRANWDSVLITSVFYLLNTDDNVRERRYMDSVLSPSAVLALQSALNDFCSQPEFQKALERSIKQEEGVTND